MFNPFAATADYLTTIPPTTTAPLHPLARTGMDEYAKQPGAHEMPPAQAREMAEQRASLVPRRNDPVANVQDRIIPGPDCDLRIRLYTPEGAAGPFPLLLYFYGGGWVIGTLEGYDDLCRSLCHHSGAMVASVEYRLAPEHRFPAAIDDCFTALRWCVAHAEQLGADANRVAVAGDSAGGNLAAAAALMVRDQNGPRLAMQALIYPVTNPMFDTASYHQWATNYGLTRDGMRYFWQCYLSQPDDYQNPYAVPMLAKDLAGLPPAIVLTAHYDVLRDDGEVYAARLHQAGVPVQCIRYLDMFHGFLQYSAVFESGLHGVQVIGDALRSAFIVD